MFEIIDTADNPLERYLMAFVLGFDESGRFGYDIELPDELKSKLPNAEAIIRKHINNLAREIFLDIVDSFGGTPVISCDENGFIKDVIVLNPTQQE